MENQKPATNITRPRELTWQALEYSEHKKHPLWFIGLAVFIAGMVLYGIYTGSWSTIVAFVLFGIMAFFYASKKPQTVTVKLDSVGVHAGKMDYNYSVIKRFWIVYNPPEVKVLYLETNAYVDHHIRIELGNQDPRAVKSFLKQYLEEDLEGEEGLLDALARKIKF